MGKRCETTGNPRRTTMQRLGLRAKLLLPTTVFAVLIGIAGVWYVRHMAAEQTEQMEQSTRHEADRLANQMSEVRDYYTRNVVAPALQQKLTVTHDYARKSGALPLPATMTHELNDSLSKKEGYTIRLYSA